MSKLKQQLSKLSFEDKIFFYSICFAFILSIIMIVENIIINFPFSANYKWFISIIISSIAMYTTYFQKKYLKIIQLLLFGLIIFFLFPMGSIAVGADYNYSFSYAFLILICVCYFFEGKARLFFIFSQVLMVLIMLIASIHYPQIFMNVDKSVHQVDRLFQIPITLVASTFIISVYANEHRKEQKNLQEYSKLLDIQNKALEQLSITDDLTGIYKRKYVLDYIHSIDIDEDEIYLVGMIDIDDFKNINDTYGHDVGDKVIINISTYLNEIISNYGLIGRYGGDEFIAFIIVPEEIVLNEIIDKLKALKLVVQDDNNKITLSGGFVQFNSRNNINKVLSEADKLLYKVKIEGKSNIIYSLEES